MSARIEFIWYKDVRDFFTNTDNIIKFIPDSRMTIEEQLNASFRFSIYFSVIIALIRQDARVLFFAIFVGLFTVILYEHDEKEKRKRQELLEKLEMKQNRDKTICALPTKNNPFMNVLISDYSKAPQRPQACNVNSKDVKQRIKEYTDTPQDLDDVFNRKALDRQFYTNPSTTIPNKQTEFAHWLYNVGSTCKEATSKCTMK